MTGPESEQGASDQSGVTPARALHAAARGPALAAASPFPAAAAPGLSEAQARARLRRDGRNEIRRERETSASQILGRQFRGAMVWLLAGAAVISFGLGELLDATAVLAILILNAAVGFFQEYRSERAVIALRSMTAPRAHVLRDGRVRVLPAAEIVVGDVLVLEAGDVVAADGRLIEAHALRAIEAALTGESLPSRKAAGAVAPGAPLAERSDCVFMGTAIASGTGLCEVTATAMQTELGKIAHLLASTSEQSTPLQQRLEQVGRVLLLLCLGVVMLVAVVGLLRGEAWPLVLMTAVSLAVAAVPEGLAASVTVALALGVRRMARRNVLVRSLPAVETLGCTSVICTDKTGTLTAGSMSVREVWGPDPHAVLDTAAACCDAELGLDARHGVGDPTEIAILVRAAAQGIQRSQIEAERPRRAVQPFDSARKRMSIWRADGVLYVKGAIEGLLPLARAGAAGLHEAAAEMAGRGLRVLAVARGRSSEERELELLGLLGLADPPRPEVIVALRDARRAGIRTVMITGDHPITAHAIARELGIVARHEQPQELVHARATPEQKLAIVRRWKDRGEIVAMTGDGVNDAPALREAHIGIAMGRAGTEVTREASDMILTDDNFASIVAAVREGRGVFENIRKSLVYLLAGNAGELLIMLGASLFGLPLPLVPLQILWINLVTDGLPGLALVADPPTGDVLSRPPRPLREPILGKPQWLNIFALGLVQAGVTLGLFLWALSARGLDQARTLAFTVLVFGELFRAFAARSATLGIFAVRPRVNVLLSLIVLGSAALQIGMTYLPWSQTIFRLHPLSSAEVGLCLCLGLVPMLAAEAFKLVRGARSRAAGG